MRITSGKYRGRNLDYPDGPATHPMGDREKLALFNSLGDLVQGAIVLDLFAGSGALGLEALSRGAKSVVFVEKSRQAVQVIKANIGTLDVTSVTKVVPVAVEKFLQDGSVDNYKKYDLILIDPPYEQFEKVDKLDFTSVAEMLASGGRVVLSHPGLIAPAELLPGLKLVSTRKYAKAHLSVFER